MNLPGLRGARYEITSPVSEDYNCIAWALGLDDQRWDPLGDFGDYWPASLSRDIRTTTVVALFVAEGFERCGDGSLEASFEKIALFAEDGLFTHVARQLDTGMWTSKLGDMWDIEHDLEDLIRRRSPRASYRYGEIAGFMRRLRP